jgi:hypothetical protein
MRQQVSPQLDLISGAFSGSAEKISGALAGRAIYMFAPLNYYMLKREDRT